MNNVPLRRMLFQLLPLAPCRGPRQFGFAGACLQNLKGCCMVQRLSIAGGKAPAACSGFPSSAEILSQVAGIFHRAMEIFFGVADCDCREKKFSFLYCKGFKKSSPVIGPYLDPCRYKSRSGLSNHEILSLRHHHRNPYWLSDVDKIYCIFFRLTKMYNVKVWYNLRKMTGCNPTGKGI